NRSASGAVIRPKPQPISTQVPPRGSSPSREKSDSSSVFAVAGSPTYCSTRSEAAAASQVLRIPSPTREERNGVVRGKALGFRNDRGRRPPAWPVFARTDGAAFERRD